MARFVRRPLLAISVLGLCLFLLPAAVRAGAAPAIGGVPYATSPPEGIAAPGVGMVPGEPGAAPELPDAVVWSDNFDAYATGSQLHGQGGWKGWANDPGAGALTSSAQAHSAPNSAAIVGASDLVHEYSGASSGLFVYTAWQYVPAAFTGQSYFILLNTYNDAGSGLNWSVQVQFDAATNTVVNEGATGGTTALIRDQWVRIRLEIDLTADLQRFYYGSALLYTGTWTDEVSGGGAANIGAVDLFANNASTVFYDDMSLETGEPAMTLVKTVGLDLPPTCAPTSQILVEPGTTVYYCYYMTNTGNMILDSHDLVDTELGTLLTDFAFAIAPGTGAYLTGPSAVIVETTVNDATWSAEVLGGTTASATASAIAEVPATNVLLEIPTLSTVGLALLASVLAGVAVFLVRRRSS